MSKERDIEQINKVFAPYNLSVSQVIEGLRINQYKVELPIEGNLNKYSKLEKNLMVALDDNGIRTFQEGKYLVIEKKNDKNTMLTMDECFFKSMYGVDKKYPLVLGKDIQGKTVRTSLVKAPHILVSGCTGSGKTQMLHSFIASILLAADTTSLILIDPKGDEFNVYKDHKAVEFISDVNAAVRKLDWLVTEMNNRYAEKEKLGINDFDDTRFTRIVCIIDEFADLIGRNKNVEKSVVMLAQKARNAGIHLIIATQYPKKEVLTGLIKANIPTRVCLKVNDNIESRVAIDRTGGERLIGHGDLLYIGNDLYDPIHLQAPYISMEDKKKVLAYATQKYMNVHMPKDDIIPEAPNPKPTYKPIEEPKKDPAQPKKAKKLGLFGTIKALWNASPYFIIEEP